MTRAIAALWLREIRLFLRDKSRVIGALVQPLALWALFGLGFNAAFQMPGADLTYSTYLFPGIVVLVLLFTAIFSTISVVEDRQRGVLQAALVAPQPRAVVALGVVTGGTTLAVGQAALVGALAPLAGLAPGALGFAVALVGCTLLAVAFTALGFVMAWRLDTTRGFHAVMNLVLMPLWLLSGAFFPSAGAPAALAWAMRLNPATYGVAVVRHGLAGLGAAPGTDVPLGLALGVSGAFAALALAGAIWTAGRPLYAGAAR